MLITLRKCSNHLQHYRAGRRHIDREVPVAPVESSSPGWQMIAAEPTPEQAAVLGETLELLLDRLEPRDREILGLHLQGCDIAAISARIGRARRTVRRVLEQIRHTLERLLAGQELV
jgi:DNA-directed RNA polymerase specialized sigma24 family protein